MTRIVEHKDADAEILKIREINVGIYIFSARELFETLPRVKNENSQGEYYLPDVVKIYIDRGEKIIPVLIEDARGNPWHQRSGTIEKRRTNFALALSFLVLSLKKILPRIYADFARMIFLKQQYK